MPLATGIAIDVYVALAKVVPGPMPLVGRVSKPRASGWLLVCGPTLDPSEGNEMTACIDKV